MAEAKNKGEWGEPYVALRLLGDRKLSLADDDGREIPGRQFNIIDIIRYETADRIVKYHYDKSFNNVVVDVNGKQVVSVPITEFKSNAEKLKDEIKAGRGRAFTISQRLKSFLEKIQMEHLKAKSVDKCDIFISAEDPRYSIFRESIGFSIKSKFGKDPSLFNTNPCSAVVYKVQNCNKSLMYTVNTMFNKSGHVAVMERCSYLLDNDCVFEFAGFPVAKKANCESFRENLEILNPRLVDYIDLVLRTHYMTNYKARSISEMTNKVAEINPCSISRPKEKYEYMIKSFLYAAYCGLTAATVWDGKSNVNGGFISVDEDGTVTANLALESESFKNYLYKHCYFEWPDTSKSHGDYAYVYEKDGYYYFNLNFSIRYE